MGGLHSLRRRSLPTAAAAAAPTPPQAANHPAAAAYLVGALSLFCSMTGAAGRWALLLPGRPPAQTWLSSAVFLRGCSAHRPDDERKAVRS